MDRFHVYTPVELATVFANFLGDGLFLRQLRLRPSFNCAIKSSAEGQIKTESVTNVAKM